MAEALIGAAAEPIVEMVIRKAHMQASRLLHFKQDLKRLERKFTYMNGYLKDAELMSRNNKTLKNLLQEIQDIAWDAEDILEECAVQPTSSIGCVSSFSDLRYRYRMNGRIKAIQERVKSICDDLHEQNVIFQRIPQAWSSASVSQKEAQFFKRCSVPLDDKPVGMGDKIEKIISWLEDPTTKVVAVLGMGGLGKTLLLQHVFKETRGRYDNSIWLSVSQKYSIKALQCDVGTTIGLENLGNLSIEMAAEKIYQRLQGTRCLVVLDDVWNEDCEASIMVRIGLPRGEYSRSQYIISTRSREVCQKMSARPVYEMQHLSDEESWILFCRHSFPDDNQPPEHLQQLARNVEKECAKLPLAIKTIGAAMRDVTSIEDWETKLRQIRAGVVGREEPVMSILRLSYDFLPSQLKPCYLYLSIFSAQEDIDCNYLIDLWIAEGFIPKEDTTEDCCSVAWRYLSELFNLCLIEPLDRCVGHIKVGFCKVHDLMRDVCVGICREYTCLSTDGGNFTELLQRPWRRIALPGIQSIPDSARCPPALRTLRLFSNPRLANIPPNFFTDVKVVRVLDLSNTDITTLPESVGNMKLLKVLNLRNTFIREIPACVRSLKGSLQLLDISKPDIVPPGPPIAVPDWIGELRCLRHLSLHSHHSENSLSKDSRTMPKSLAKLTSLVTLKVGSIKIVLEDEDKLGLEGLATLTRLQELDLCFEGEGYQVYLRPLSTLDLRRFTVRVHGGRRGTTTVKVGGFFHLRWLSELECRGWCEVFEEVCSCISLELLRVDFRILKFDGSRLQTMPKLRLLELHGDDNTSKLPHDFARPDGFPKLERLVIFKFPSLKKLPMLGDGSMRCLKELCVSGCPRLKRIPDGLERLPKLESLRVVNCGEMGERLKENNEDWSKMKGSNNNVQITSYHF